MLIEVTEIERYGEPIIKYRLNIDGTKHQFLYKYKGRYYSFTKFKGQLTLDWLNETPSNTTLIKPSKAINTKSVKEWYNSSLNEWFKHSHKWYDGRYSI